MEKEENIQNEENQDDASDATINTDEGKGKQGPPETVPYDRLQEVISERNTLKEQVESMSKDLQKIKDAQELDRTKKLEENEQFKELADEWKGKFEALNATHEGTTEALTAHEAALTSFAESQMDSVPELYRDIVQKLPLLERLTWLSENSDKLKTEAAAKIPHTPKGSGIQGITDDERRRRAARTF